MIAVAFIAMLAMLAVSTSTVFAAPSLGDLAVTTPIDENGTATLTGSLSDPDGGGYILDVDWGDGSALETFTYPAGSTSFSETHQYLDAIHLGHQATTTVSA